MSIPTVKQRLDRLRRRRDFLADRIPQQTVVPHYDKSECSALSWVIRFVEDHYKPESPEVERNPSNSCRAESRDFQKHPRGEPTKPAKAPEAPESTKATGIPKATGTTKATPLAPTVPHGIAHRPRQP
jgi:hypothetical protein